ncbi:MAG: sigma-54 dependent transcriptional regulator [Ignavibacterium sp.]
MQSKIKILIVDDDDLVCISTRNVLTKLGYLVEICMDANKSLDTIKNFSPDLILLDIYLGADNGLNVLKRIKQDFSHIPVIMITGYSDVKIAIESMKLGAADFLMKPLDIDQLDLIIKKNIEHIKLKEEVDKLYNVLSEEDLPREYFGKSSVIQNVLNIVEKYANSPNTTILLEGESGTGKEVISKYIHQKSPRRNNVFIGINCAAIPKELAESELFGHEKGAFTGAAPKTKLGKFELANGGTLLLDEIAELNMEMQAKILRVLEEKKFYRVGGEKEVSIDVRLITATNKNLEQEVQKGNFREDLFYRLNVARIKIPPLRERKDDIPILAYSFVKEFSNSIGKTVKTIHPDTIDLLKNYYWKGNIRELRNVIERAMLMVEGDELKSHHFRFLEEEKISDEYENKFILKIPPKGITIDQVLKSLILQTLEITKGNQVRAAKILGLTRSKLRYRMEQLNIEISKKIN